MRPTIVVLVCLLIPIINQANGGAKYKDGPKNSDSTVHHYMTKREINQVFGVDSHEKVPSYEIVTPFQADETGEFISHSLHKNLRRRRRSLEPTFNEREVIFYKLNAFGQDLHLEVKHNKELLTPRYEVEIRSKNNSKIILDTKNSFYRGSVTSEPDSMVSISNDGGLGGIIQVADQYMFIMPIPERLSDQHKSEQGGQPHVIYRQLSDEDNEDFHGYTKDKTPDKRESLLSQAIKARNRVRRDADKIAKRTTASKWMEVVMMGDSSLMDKYGEEFIPKYFALMAQMIDGLYTSSSIGEIGIHFRLAKSVIISNEELGILSNYSMGLILDAVEFWARNNYNSYDTSGHHFDTVALVTGSNCGGYAAISSLCSSTRSASVSSDYGLQTFFTIAHEIGHNIGAPHDGGSEECPNNQYIMSSATAGGSKVFTWSPCSSNAIQNRFSLGRLDCLSNDPGTYEEVPTEWQNLYPGEIFDSNKQCEMMYGEGYHVCSVKTSYCGSLFCTLTGSVCYSKMSPMIDGTRCGVRNWCQKGDCVDDGSPYIHGGWTEWSQIGPCSKTCGSGLRWRSRTCTNPTPQNGGDNCPGYERDNHQTCNNQPCGDYISDRRVACTTLDPSYKEYYSSNPCDLVCAVDYRAYYYGTVMDGTRTTNDFTDLTMCILGQVVHVGCDFQLQSTRVNDVCGVCAGDGISCDRVDGRYDKDYRGRGFSNGDLMVIVPLGSTTIHSKQDEVVWHYTGVREIIDGVKGDIIFSQPSWSRTTFYAGTKIDYYREENEDRDSITIPGPISEPLGLEFLRTYGLNQGVTYYYHQPNSNAPNASAFIYYWSISDFSNCSVTCGEGQVTREVTCLRVSNHTQVDDEYCTETKPTITESCSSSEDCDIGWYEGSWSECSKSCANGTQTREVTCKRQKYNSTEYMDLDDSECSGTKPISEQFCNEVDCSPEWEPLDWGQCSKVCGGGIRQRELKCVQINSIGEKQELNNSACEGANEVTTEEVCGDVPCYVPIGCFKDKHNEIRPLPELLHDFSSESYADDEARVVEECSLLAADKGYTHFGIENRYLCLSGANAGKTFAVDSPVWKGIKHKCSAYVGIKPTTVFIYTTEPDPLIKNLGCYGDNIWNRALGNLYASLRYQISWYNLPHVISQCSRIAASKDHKYFAVQFWGECWTSQEGEDAVSRYTKHGPSTNCYNNIVGKGNAFIMYEIE